MAGEQTLYAIVRAVIVILVIVITWWVLPAGVPALLALAGVLQAAAVLVARVGYLPPHTT